MYILLTYFPAWQIHIKLLSLIEQM